MENIQDTACGKISPAHCPPTKARILKTCSKASAKSKKMFLFLNLKNGQMREKSWEITFHSHGECLMLGISECPKEENESTLSQILMAIVPGKYYLSPKACRGILRRASERGKELPKVLEIALRRQSQSARMTKAVKEWTSPKTKQIHFVRKDVIPR